MILVDANLLVYAWSARSPQNERARAWLDDRLGGTVRVGLPWPSLLAFLRLVTNPRVFPDPAPVARAFAQVRGWLAAAPTWIPLPTDRHSDVLETVLGSGGGNLVPDAHLAALAIEHGLVLCSTDSDFARFPGLRWENPIAD